MRYDIERDEIELSVNELCDAAELGGHIDCRRPSASTKLRSADGKRAYSILQSRYGATYHAEVELSNTSRLGDIYFHVAGRADGIQLNNGVYTVDEIRTVSRARFMGGVIDQRHSAALYAYAYFLCLSRSLDGVVARIAYYDTEENDISFSEKYLDVDTLRRAYFGLLERIYWRAEIMRNRIRDRLPTLVNMRFPYGSLRESQEEMIKECYRDIKVGTRLFCQAPTGIGKTVSTLYPAVRRLGEGVVDRIFYLTGKASIRREALSAMRKMNDAGARARSCVIASRESMCICDAAKRRGGKLSSSCTPELCPYAANYYGKLRGALCELIANGESFDSASIRAMAQKHKICPYELSLDLSELCDVIICDYNYVFSPTVYLKRYFDEAFGKKEKYVFLIDEAHNLPDRAREIYSSRLSFEDFKAVDRLLERDDRLRDGIENVREAFEKLALLCRDNMRFTEDGREIGYFVTREMPQGFNEVISAFGKLCDTWQKDNPDHAAVLAVEDLSFKIFEYKKICDCFDGRYLTFINKDGEDISLLLYCLDPSHQLSLALDRAVSAVLFSATLTPTEYFADILGGGKKSAAVEFSSPFPPENLCIAAVDSISTRFEDREKSYKKVASCIAATVSARVGNYMVFFPSYSYMEAVGKIFHAKYPKVEIIAQKRNMTYADKEKFLSEFREDGKLRIGFCVLGGSFSEGIDLPGRRLIGAIVVGVGLPGISNENNIIRDYYEEKCGQGYDYAYTYPGMNGVLQAIGRVIRRQDDRGIAVLIDDRYAEPKYRALFPRSWQKVNYTSTAASLAEIARRFWKNE